MCTYDDANVCSICMLVCSAADALVVVAGCCWNIRVHFAAAVFVRGAKHFLFIFCIMYCLVISNSILSCPSAKFNFSKLVPPIFNYVAFLLYGICLFRTIMFYTTISLIKYVCMCLFVVVFTIANVLRS